MNYITQKSFLEFINELATQDPPKPRPGSTGPDAMQRNREWLAGKSPGPRKVPNGPRPPSTSIGDREDTDFMGAVDRKPTYRRDDFGRLKRDNMGNIQRKSSVSDSPVSWASDDPRRNIPGASNLVGSMRSHLGRPRTRQDPKRDAEKAIGKPSYRNNPRITISDKGLTMNRRSTPGATNVVIGNK